MLARLIMEHDGIYINEDVTYRSELLQYINTIINRVYNGQCDRIALEIHSKNKGVLINLGTSQERSNAHKNTDETREPSYIGCHAPTYGHL